MSNTVEMRQLQMSGPLSVIREKDLLPG